MKQKYEKNIPYKKYCIDSFKLLIDSSQFDNINIPTNFLLIDEDTGEQISSFKKKSIPIEYNGSTIYLGVFRKVLRGVNIDKVCILFSSKINHLNYFDGITEEIVINILEYLKEIGRLEFSDTKKIYHSLYVKDLDIKVDHCINRKHITQISDWQNQLKPFFVGNSDSIKIYNNQEKGLGLQCNHRDRSSYTKPFMKFYHKSKELLMRSMSFFTTLPKEIQQEVRNNFIYRYEFTIKDKKFFDKFKISNKLSDVLLVSQDKWKEIGQYYYEVNFGLVPKRVINTGKMTSTDHLLALYFKSLLDEGWSLHQIQALHMQSADSENSHKSRTKKKFDKIHSFVIGEHKEKIENDIEFINEIGSFLGFKKK